VRLPARREQKAAAVLSRKFAPTDPKRHRAIETSGNLFRAGAHAAPKVARRAVQRTQPRALLMRDLRDRIERVSLTDFTVLIDGGIAGRK
jgi:hypothetical protein